MEPEQIVIRVLVVEDFEDDALLAMRVLGRAGYQAQWTRVDTAAGLAEQLAIASWDVIISDYQLPGFNAPAALAIVKAKQLDIPFIVVSGTIGDEALIELMRAGAHDYLMKDNLTRLPEAVRRELREAQIRQERQQMLGELELTKERLELTVESAEIGIWDWDIVTGALKLNEQYASLIGYTTSELQPAQVDHWRKHIHPQDIDHQTKTLEQHFRGELVPYECEFRVRNRQGHWRWILDRGRVIAWDPQGQPQRMVGTSLDITQRKQTELRLQLQRSVLAQIAQSIPLPSVLDTVVRSLEMQLDQCLAGAIMLYDAADDQLNLAAAPHLPSPYREVIASLPAKLASLFENATFCQAVETLPATKQDAQWQAIQAMAQTCNLQSCWSVPVISSKETVLAILAVYYDHSHRPNSDEIDTVMLAADLAKIAIEQARHAAAIAQLNHQLEQRVEERTAALKVSEARFQRLASNVPGALYQLVKRQTGHLEFIYLSDRWQSMFEVDPDRGKQDANHILNRINSDDWKRLNCLVSTADPVPKPIAWEGRWQLADGSPCWVQAIAQPERQENGDILWEGLFLDISEQKGIEAKLQATIQELARATRMKDEFLANMSHELRTPLNAILGMSEGLVEQVFGELNEYQKKATDTIAQSGRHLLDLINDILDLAKIEAGKFELHLARVSIQEICDVSMTFVKQMALEKGIKLSLYIPDPLKFIAFQADDRRLRQVLINLLSNAVKFTPEKGQIELSVSLDVQSSAPQVHFQVTDNGIGIAPEQLSHIFQPFTQIDSSLNRQYTGTGLGLALVRQIVDLHQGQIDVTSTPGQGSSFKISLPYLSSDPIPAMSLEQGDDADRPQYSPLHRPLIVLAEDNEANVATLSSYLKAKGYRLLIANDGQTAINLVKHYAPQLVLMDIQMPVMDGLTAIRQLRQDPKYQHLPIIALTALAMSRDREQCLAAGATGYLTKPIKLKKLVMLIQNILLESASIYTESD